jgi:2-iminobutanoate/2-iminopropanoate deaminase
MRKAVTAQGVSPGDGPYSQGIVGRELVFVSGQGPLDREGAVRGETIEEQARLTLDNVRGILEAAGCTMDDVLKVNVILADMAHFERFNAVYRTYFREPMPARTCFGGALDGILVEIDAIAQLPEGRTGGA